MSKGKKTFEVVKFKEYVNTQLARTDDFATDDFKAALCVALEHVLHKSNNYNGYQDLYWEEFGWKQWYEGNRTEVWEEKKLFIYGTKDSKYRSSKFSRRYY